MASNLEFDMNILLIRLKRIIINTKLHGRQKKTNVNDACILLLELLLLTQIVVNISPSIVGQVIWIKYSYNSRRVLCVVSFLCRKYVLDTTVGEYFVLFLFYIENMF